MKTRKNDNLDAEWRRICSAMISDSVRIRVPRAFLSTLTLFFHHVSDAMGGDDRPDHGLSMMRRSREHYRVPFYSLYGKIKWAEKKMNTSRTRKAAEVFNRYLELSAERERQFSKKLKLIIKRTTASSNR